MNYRWDTDGTDFRALMSGLGYDGTEHEVQ